MKTKYFRVATSGKTVDNREITPAQIDQMAATYKPETYGARVWVEHLRSLLPDSPFRAYGDVLALRAEDAGDGKRALFAQIDATDDLVKMNKDRQKVYWSIEINPAFPGTGQAYMVGLAVTDSPASTGTEMLKFSLGKPDTVPDAVKSHLFSEHVEGAITADDTKPEISIFTKVKELLTGPNRADAARFDSLEKAVTEIAEVVGTLKTSIAGFSAGTTATDPQLATTVKTLSDEFAAVKEALEKTSVLPKRPAATGDQFSATATDC
ncbi:GPO family capsid scaffolding protein (plasmid) [Azospirillum sp. HJ39]|uniref:GPO family capsid scaffolding protein n=1 Tax=Azospirillum sp. HJ39 TaxID=3159496 RepID=UPI0035569F61